MADADIKKSAESTTSHKLLTFIASFFLVTGIFAFIMLFVVSGTVYNTSDFQAFAANGFHTGYLFASLAALFQGILAFALLKGFADIIVLLKASLRDDG